MMVFSRRVKVSTGRRGFSGVASRSFAIVETCLLGIHVSPAVTRRAHLMKSCGSTDLRITPAAPLRTWRIDASSDEVEAVATTLQWGATLSTADIRLAP